MEIRLGSKAKDKITGLKGIVVTKCIYLNGCVQYAIQSPVKQDGSIPGERWIDEQQLEVTGDGVKETDPIPIPRKVISISGSGGGFRNHPGG